jgi:hypothetical protein
LLPFVALTFLLIVGFGHTLSAKQHALVAARYATTYDVVHEQPPQAADLARASGSGAAQWQVSRSSDDAPQFEVGSDVLQPFADATSGLVGGTGRIGYVASTTPQRGIVPRLYPGMPAATARYDLPGSTWTCDDLGGSSYLTFALNQGGVGEILGTDGQECCEHYESN